MNKTEISKNYNIDKMVTAKELASLSRTYKDNLETIIVMMKRKTVNPPQPPAWFQNWSENVYEKKPPQWFKEWSENVYEKQPPSWFTEWNQEVFSNVQAFITEQKKFNENIVKLNNLRTE